MKKCFWIWFRKLKLQHLKLCSVFIVWILKLFIQTIIYRFQVHKVIPGTLADRDGRIQKGDRVLSINGRSTKGVTHREALSILKVRNSIMFVTIWHFYYIVFAAIELISFVVAFEQAPRTEVVLVLSRSRSVTPAEGAAFSSADRADYAAYNYINMSSSGRPPKILESPLDSKSLLSGNYRSLQ